jgi:23S rRNA (cytidine2498-2'-O)-methyltransferase
MESLWAILAPTEFVEETRTELKFKHLQPIAQAGNFFLFRGEPRHVAWAAVTWLEVKRLPAPSIGAAAKALRPLARRWALLPSLHHRRASLIFEQLRPLPQAPVEFPTALALPEGSAAFTMLDAQEVLWCRFFDRPDPLGRVEFSEDRESAPSRAYLKLWEALCLSGKWPAAGERCVDLGACPGGWTWVLASLGARVLAVDRAPLDPRIATMPGVSFRKGDAFQAKPSSLGKVDWLCSDVICVPEKLLELVEEWVAAEAALHYVCTLKFQGAADPAVVAGFERLGRVLHLAHNKHELTFVR